MNHEGNILRVARQFYGWNQKELANLIGVNKSYISEIESGKRPVSLKVIRRYSKVLGVPASSILFFMEEVAGDTQVNHRDGILQDAALRLLNWIRDQFPPENDHENPGP